MYDFLVRRNRKLIVIAHYGLVEVYRPIRDQLHRPGEHLGKLGTVMFHFTNYLTRHNVQCPVNFVNSRDICTNRCHDIDCDSTTEYE